MIRAYNELYLSDARRLLANSFDYSVYSLGIPIEQYYKMFIKSDLATRFEKGDPFILAGKSGIELALLVIEKNTGVYEYKEQQYSDGKSPEYWAGWALAYYQWYSGISFRVLDKTVPITMVIDMYPKYHEMDIMQFADRIDDIRMAARLDSYLKKCREACGYTQSELSELTGIPLRTLQHYEQGTKSLDRANAIYILALSNALSCSPAELIGS